MDHEGDINMLSNEDEWRYSSQSSRSSAGPALFEEQYDPSISEVSSVLSDPPSDLDFDVNIAIDADLEQLHASDDRDSQPRSPSHVRRSQILCLSELDSESKLESDIEGESEVEGNSSDWGLRSAGSEADDKLLDKGPLEEFFYLKVGAIVSHFESLPYEILQNIVICLSSDSDFLSLILTCHTFARQLQPENSCVWKSRFLQKYDHPIIEGSFDFCVAYKLRTLLLPRFTDIGFDKKRNARILLELLKDMILETYNIAFPWQTALATSRNIAAFSKVTTSAWMVHFLSTPFFGRDQKEIYGRPHKLFDTLQVVFSYLVLNRSAMAFQVGRDKSDYDLSKVYRYDQPFALLYAQLPDKQQEPTPPPFTSSIFPNLRRESPAPRIRFQLDMNILLHVRNFWHRHLTETKAMSGEETYGNMAARLAKTGISPKAWVRPLQEPTTLSGNWYGHYSCIYPWPKTSKLLQNKETEAEVWDNMDPLHLDFSISSEDTNDAWPEIFATIPAFAKTLDFPLNDPERHGVRFLRGLAPFQVVEHIRNPQPQHTLSVTHHHPFTRLRLRGILHNIPDQAGIPGWRRAVFVLYRPLWRHLVEVFDYATEYFGEPFQQHLNQTFGADLAGMTHDQLEEQHAAHLTALLAELKGPLEMSRTLIEHIEDRCCAGEKPSWEDVEHAYAYEGIITPGGMVMLGRWWRVGPPGVHTSGEGQEYGDSATGWERGPFVFWAA